jgi:hypothetical protein
MTDNDPATEVGSHVLASEATPEAVEAQPAADAPEEAPAPLEPQEFRDRFEKAFQLRGLPIPEVTDEWLLAQRDAGATPIDAFESFNA